ncbi:MAG: hypothetical protein P1P90_02495 [Patescibacteria group bacterium]|nr:hypothetical protein [Patescibacteria group bacterium]
MADHEIELHETIKISDSWSVRTESHYLLISNREKCHKLLQRLDLDENDMIDFFISLHLVLEIGLNTFYRQITLMGIQKTVNKKDIIKNLDGINFIDKTILFIYNSKFNFQNISEADRHHSVFGKIRDFNSIRNQLLHGHSIGTISQNGTQSQTVARSALNRENLEKRLKAFKEILDSIKFYFGSLESVITESGKEDIKREFLDYGFLE